MNRAYEIAILLYKQGIIEKEDIGLVTAIIELQEKEPYMDNNQPSNIKKAIVLIIIGIIVATWLASVIGAIAQKSHTPDQSAATPMIGLTIDRSTYTASCKHGYRQTGVPSIGNDRITAYCDCTYDTGVTQFGETVFLQKLSSTPLPSDISKIVNKCLQEALK